MILKQSNIKPVLYSLFINLIWLVSSQITLSYLTSSVKIWTLILNNFIIGILNYFFIINKNNKIYFILNLYLICSSIIFNFPFSIQLLTILIAIFNILISVKKEFLTSYYGLIPYAIIYSIVPIITINYLVNGYITIEVIYNSFAIFSLYLIFYTQKFDINYSNKLNIISLITVTFVFLTLKMSIFNIIILFLIFVYYLNQLLNRELPVYLSIFIFLIISLIVCI